MHDTALPRARLLQFLVGASLLSLYLSLLSRPAFMSSDSAWLSTSDLHRWRACARKLWWSHQAPSTEPTSPAGPIGAGRQREGLPAVARLVDDPGREAALQASFPGLRRITGDEDPEDWDAACALTRAAMDDPASVEEGWALAGACVRSPDGVQARIDLLTRGPMGWRVFRVRHATAGTEADVDTVAWAVHALAHGGWRVQGAGLMLIETSFMYPGHGCYAGLYREVDLGPVLGTRPVADWIVQMRRDQRGGRPALPWGAPCAAAGGGCEYRLACGIVDDPESPASDPTAAVDILGREQASTWRARGIRQVHELPLDALPSDRARRQVLAVRRGRPIVEPGARQTLQALTGTRRWVRVETIGFAVPPWAGTQPYQILPFQWTLGEEREDGQGLRVLHHLAPGREDPRRAWAESLLAAAGTEGPLIAYNAGFERNRVRELAVRFEDLRPALEALLERFVDLFALCREHAYHPAMAGSWSARAVFRAFVPEVGAHRFVHPACPTPLDAYALALQPAPQDGARAATERYAALRSHGERQVEALWRLTQVLEGEPSIAASNASPHA